jgi:hypothetical protein
MKYIFSKDIKQLAYKPANHIKNFKTIIEIAL